MRDATERLGHRLHIEANNSVYGSGLCEKLSDTIVDKKFPEGRWAHANHEARDCLNDLNLGSYIAVSATRK
jgi:hypothetical protein